MIMPPNYWSSRTFFYFFLICSYSSFFFKYHFLYFISERHKQQLQNDAINNKEQTYIFFNALTSKDAQNRHKYNINAMFPTLRARGGKLKKMMIITFSLEDRTKWRRRQRQMKGFSPPLDHHHNPEMVKSCHPHHKPHCQVCWGGKKGILVCPIYKYN